MDDQQRDRVPVPPNAFLDRWHEIVSPVDRNRVNFACVESREGALVVAVEWKPPAAGMETWPAHPIFVNWCGPPWKFGDDGRPTGEYQADPYHVPSQPGEAEVPIVRAPL